MNEHDPLLTDAALDRLVDGELTDAARRELLAALDANPGAWRRCALAFLESQSLRAQLGAVAAMPGDLASENAPQLPASGEAEAPTPIQHGLQSRGAAGRSSAAHRALQWLAIAASLLVAFGIGWQFSLRALDGPRGAELLAGDPPQSTTPQQPEPAAPQLDPRDAVTLVVRDASGAPQRLRIPLVEAERLGGALADANAWQPPAPLRERLRDNGLDLQVRRRYAPMFFENDGGLSPMVVPVDDAVVTPVSRQVF
ncbi:MAG: hypothetical protein KDA44_18630 [Planctomycetales bacterium]|nr:hypothetical protein [Planctomycetales bacterium]